MAIEDFVIGAANSKRQCPHKDLAVRLRRLRDVIELNRILDAGKDGDSAH
jgi:hypothetical protein